MPAPLSGDLRDRIVRAVEGGASARAAAARFDVSPSSAVKLMQRVRPTGSAKPAKYGGYRRPLLGPYEADLRAMVEAAPDITLAEIKQSFAERGVAVGITAIHHTLRRLGLRHKKSR